MTMSVNKSQPHCQRPLEAAGRVASVPQAPAGDSRVELEAKPLCLARFVRQDSARKRQDKKQLLCSKRDTSSVALQAW